MDDSLYSGSVGLPGSSQGTTHGSGSTRFGSSAGQMNARNLFDESMDLDAAGTQDTDIPDEQSDFRRGYATENAAYQYTGPSRNGEEARLPSSELGHMHLHDQAYRSSTTTAGTPNLQHNNLEEAVHSPTKPDEDDNNDLPTVPPLSTEERRQQALTRERDDLAKMNTLLEHAIASISRTVPKMEVSLPVQSTSSTRTEHVYCRVHRISLLTS